MRQLLEDPGEADQLTESNDAVSGDRDWAQALEQAMTEEAQGSLDEGDQDWLDMRASDLARAMATLWWDVGTDDSARSAAADRWLCGLPSGRADAFEELGRRFELSPAEIGQVLSAVQSHSAVVVGGAIYMSA